MYKLVIPDTSCLIALHSLKLLDLLQRFYSEASVPPGVNQEYGEELPTWMKLKEVENKLLVSSLKRHLGRGESEVIAISTETEHSVVVLDDKKARIIAKDLGVKVTGTLGLILRAKSEGSLVSVRNAISTLEDSGFRISDELYSRILELSGED